MKTILRNWIRFQNYFKPDSPKTFEMPINREWQLLKAAALSFELSKKRRREMTPNKAQIKQRVAEIKKQFDFEKFSEKDFYRICRSERITLLNSKDTCEAMDKIKPLLGLYLRYKGEKSFIWLRSFHKKKLSLITAAHELGHHFLSHRAVSFKDKNYGAKSDLQEEAADYFAKLMTFAPKKSRAVQGRDSKRREI